MFQWQQLTQNLTRKKAEVGPLSYSSFRPPFFSGNLSYICLMSTAWTMRKDMDSQQILINVHVDNYLLHNEQMILKIISRFIICINTTATCDKITVCLPCSLQCCSLFYQRLKLKFQTSIFKQSIYIYNLALFPQL